MQARHSIGGTAAGASRLRSRAPVSWRCAASRPANSSHDNLPPRQQHHSNNSSSSGDAPRKAGPSPQQHQQRNNGHGGGGGAAWLRRQRVLRPAASPRGGDVLELNVGGTVMVTTRGTLTQLPGSRLAAMFAPAAEARLPRDGFGRVFVDLDPRAFGAVLRYLRELRLAGGNVASVPQPDVRPEDAACYQHLVAYLKLSALQPRPEAAEAAAAAAEERVLMRASSAPSAALSDGSGSSAAPRRASAHGARPHNQPRSGGARTDQPASRPLLRRPPARGGAAASAPEPLAPASQLLYIQAHQQADSSSSSGSSSAGAAAAAAGAAGAASSSLPRISVFTDADLRAGAASPRDAFDIFADATYEPRRLRFAFVCRRDFDDFFVGATSVGQLEQRGLGIPCFGWKRVGCRYSAAAGDDGGSSDGGAAAAQLISTSAPSSSGGQQRAAASSAAVAAAGAAAPLWKRGDAVELVLELPPPAGAAAPGSAAASRTGSSSGGASLTLRVNGAEVDRLGCLPAFRSWAWYLALYSGADVGCVAVGRDAVGVYWGDYQVKRFLAAQP